MVQALCSEFHETNHENEQRCCNVSGLGFGTIDYLKTLIKLYVDVSLQVLQWIMFN